MTKYFKEIILFTIGVAFFFSYPAQGRRIKDAPSTSAYSIIETQKEFLSWPFIPADSTLLRDSNGKKFIVLDKSYRSDYLAYLLGKDIFNLPEIRIIKSGWDEGTALSSWMEKKGLSEIGISRLVQDYTAGDLPVQENSLEALVVFWTFLRDGDHHFYLNLYDFSTEAGERIYMSYDHGNMALGTVSITSWIEDRLQENFKRLFNVANLNPDVIINIAHQAQKYYTNEKLTAIVTKAGFGEDLLQVLKSRRDSLVFDVETLLIELGVSQSKN